MYSPLEPVVAHLSAAESAAHTVAPATAAFVEAFVTFPEIWPPGSRAALTSLTAAPVATSTRLASEAVSLSL